MVTTTERRRQWQFNIGEGGVWYWTATSPDGTREKSQLGFQTLKDCTADAVANGYVAWQLEQERRRA